MTKLKVLVSAYACEPDKGSEPGVGWNWTKQIARFHETWVITRANNRESIERELKKHPVANLHLVYYDLPKWLSFWKKGPRGMHLYYFFWQIGIWRIAKKLNKMEKFDIVHHLTFGSVFLPTFMPLLDVPFVWGPIGGAEQVPRRFRKKWAILPRLKESLRDVLVRTLGLNPLFRLPSGGASLILTKTEDTARCIPSRYAANVVVTCDVGISPEAPAQDGGGQAGLRVLLVGSLEAWRGFDLALQSFALAAENIDEMKLIILGTGSEMAHLTQLAGVLGIQDKVLFAGKVRQQQYREYLRTSDIVMNPCLKEGGVTVLFDSLMCGKPVVCLDVAGSSRIIRDECGIRVNLTTPEDVVRNMASALEKLACDQSLRKRMGEWGREFILREYSWGKKGDFIRELYSRILPDVA